MNPVRRLQTSWRTERRTKPGRTEWRIEKIRIDSEILFRSSYTCPVLNAGAEKGSAVFASFSAAHWLAPYGRTGMQYFYADSAGLERLKTHLKLSTAPKGENVVIILPKDDGIFRDAVKPAPEVVCTSPVQTYLDLAAAGERGREAADHLRQEKLKWPA